jgi:urease accessory protein
VINKIDLAPYVGADLSVMEKDAKAIRTNNPYVFVNCRTGEGILKVTDQIVRDVLFESSPKAIARR